MFRLFKVGGIRFLRLGCWQFSFCRVRRGRFANAAIHPALRRLTDSQLDAEIRAGRVDVAPFRDKRGRAVVFPNPGHSFLVNGA
jgi:hypothetical protein